MGATIGDFLNKQLGQQPTYTPPPPPPPLTPAQQLAILDNQAIERGYCYRSLVLPKRYKDRLLPAIYGYGRTIQSAMDDATTRFIERCIKLKPNRTFYEFETATYCISPRLAAQYDREYQSEPVWDYTDPLIEEIILSYEDDRRYRDGIRGMDYNTPYWDDQPFSQ